MQADPDDLAARIVEAAARAASKPLANMHGGCFRPDGRDPRGDCADGDCYCVRVSRHCARAAIAAAVREAGLTRAELEDAAHEADAEAEREMLLDVGNHALTAKVAALLNALAGIADA